MFSTIIPAYNAARWVGAAIDSVLGQTFQDQEIMCIDDGSTDETADVVARYVCSGVKLLRQNNRGPGAARNHGVRHASGKYVVFMDADDLWFPWTLSAYAEVIRKFSEPALVVGKLTPFADECEVRGLTQSRLEVEWFGNYLASSRRGLYCASCQACVRRDILVEVGGFTEQPINAEDHDLTMRLGTAPGFAYVHAPVMVGYRQHQGSLTTNLTKTYLGISHLLDQEKKGAYPGGSRLRWERRRILSAHLRPVSLALLSRAERERAWELYWKSFGWHLGLRRFAYLFGFGVLATTRGGQRASQT